MKRKNAVELAFGVFAVLLSSAYTLQFWNDKNYLLTALMFGVTVWWSGYTSERWKRV